MSTLYNFIHGKPIQSAENYKFIESVIYYAKCIELIKDQVSANFNKMQGQNCGYTVKQYQEFVDGILHEGDLLHLLEGGVLEKNPLDETVDHAAINSSVELILKNEKNSKSNIFMKFLLFTLGHQTLLRGDSRRGMRLMDVKLVDKTPSVGALYVELTYPYNTNITLVLQSN
ncbi:unnamed protein product [Ambrosiozyma monospora]|uniref:Unnamed protein product n=1 Tax=Ambrosiozyma monospora TaxID=43982 RepID=A0A9W7DEC8_AMBMO|nr:unnamed protein product [Ambrosiozyma monospora]